MCEDPKNKQYTFRTIGYDSKEVESNRLEVTDGIVLRFNRYSLFQGEIGAQYQNFNLNSDFPTKLSIYGYCRKHILEGYIYMYSEKLQNITEFKCVAGILIQGPQVKWSEQTSDFREFQAVNEYKDYHLVKKGNTYWFAYSTEQWAAKYVSSMVNNQQLREKRFQKLDTKNLADNPDVASYEKIKIYYNEDSPDEYERIANDKYKLGLSSISTLKDKTPYVYFSLHDPIGCATDLRKDQLIALGDLNLLVNSILKNTQASSKYTNDDFYYLHLHALIFYNMFYGKSSGSADTDKTINTLKEKIAAQQFLEKMLLVEERERTRTHANNIRTAMLRFVDSDYYRSVLDDFIENHPRHMECGIERVVEHHKGISMDANLIDRHLDLKDTCSPFNKDISKYMKEAASVGHKIDELLSKGYDLEDFIYIEKNKDIDIAETIKTGDMIWSNMTNAGIAWMDHIRETIAAAAEALQTSSAAGKGVNGGVRVTQAPKGQFLVIEESAFERWFNKVEIKERTIKGPRGGIQKISCWILDEIDLDKILKEMHCIKKEAYIKRGGTGNKGKVGTRVRRVADSNGKIIGGYRRDMVIEVLIDEAAKSAGEAAQKTPAQLPKSSKLLKAVEGILTSKAFMGLTSFVSACNLAASVSTADFNKAPVSGFISIAGAITELGQFITNFISLFSELPEHLAKRLMTLSKGLGVVATTAIGVVNIIDGATAIRQNNTKAGLAYIGSAVGFFAAAGISVGLMLRTPPKWARNKYLIIAYAVGIGLMLLAIYLTHTPMEKFLANCILKEGAMKKVKGWKTMQGHEIMQRLCENKEDIIGDEFPKWHNLRESFECFIMLLMNMKVNATHEKPKAGKWYDGFSTTHVLKKVSIECFYNNLTFDSDVEYSLRVFYSKPADEDYLYCKDIDGSFKEISSGCQIEYDRSLIDKAIPDTYKIHTAYFFQRVVYKDGLCFPPVNKVGISGEDKNVYFMERVDVDSLYMNMRGMYLAKSVKDIMEISGSENRAPFTVSKLNEIIGKNLFGQKMSGKRKEIINETIDNSIVITEQ